MKKDTDMKKIKSKLVTIVTDNVLGIGIVENKTRLAAHVAGKSGKAASREETKKVAMRQR
jgi:hypothetical protein